MNLHNFVNFQGIENFTAKVNLEVQWASESAIAAIEKNGGVITTAYFDPMCLNAVIDPERFFLRGKKMQYFNWRLLKALF
jgi:large subunit ribosomal protein L15